MDIKATDASAAYADALKRAVGSSVGTGAADSAKDSASSFAAMVKDVIGGASDGLKASESAAVNALQGNGELVDVVTAVTNAEVTLQTVVAIRDRVISAYQDIIRMPI